MSTWILILTLGGSGKAIDHIKFDEKSSCESAAKQFINEASWGQCPVAFCVENKHD